MKVYSPAVLQALTESLRTIYWFRDDLRSFLLRAGVPPANVAALPWHEVKVRAITELIDRLVENPAAGMPVLERIVDSVVEQDEGFPHLARLDDGKRKVDDARRCLRALKELLGKESVAERAERARRESRTEAQRAAASVQAREATLRELNERFMALVAAKDVQRRGYEFQALLRDLFALHDLDPRGSFSRPGEQTDGSISLDGTVFLVEARWKTDLTPPAEVREFRSKVQDKLDNTLGLMVSANGFTEEAVRTAAGGGRMLVILMDGQDLAQVLQGVVDLTEMLRRKLRHAAEEGGALYRVG